MPYSGNHTHEDILTDTAGVLLEAHTPTRWDGGANTVGAKWVKVSGSPSGAQADNTYGFLATAAATGGNAVATYVYLDPSNANRYANGFDNLDIGFLEFGGVAALLLYADAALQNYVELRHDNNGNLCLYNTVGGAVQNPNNFQSIGGGALKSISLSHVLSGANNVNRTITVTGVNGAALSTPLTVTVPVSQGGQVFAAQLHGAAGLTKLGVKETVPLTAGATAIALTLGAGAGKVGGQVTATVTPNGVVATASSVPITAPSGRVVATVALPAGQSAPVTVTLAAFTSADLGAINLTATPPSALGGPVTAAITVYNLTVDQTNINEPDGQSVGITATLTGGTGTLTAGVLASGGGNAGGTLGLTSAGGSASVTPPSGAAFYYKAPASGSGTDIITTTGPGGTSVVTTINYAAGEYVSVTPAGPTTVNQGTTLQLTGLTNNLPSGHTNAGVTWAIQEGASAGSVSTSGLFTAGSTPGTYHIVATSQDNPSLSATAVVVVPAVVVTLSPLNPTLPLNTSQQFVATVTGAANTNVVWSANAPNGLYAGSASATSAQITATSVADPTKSASTTVTVAAVVSILTSVELGSANTGLVGTIGFTVQTVSQVNGVLTYTTIQARTTAGIGEQGASGGYDAVFAGVAGQIYRVLWTSDATATPAAQGRDYVEGKSSVATSANGSLTDAQVQADVQAGLTQQGYTTTRAGLLDTLSGLVTSIWGAATAGLTTVGSVGSKLRQWMYGTDGKALLSSDPANDAQIQADVVTGVGIASPTLIASLMNTQVFGGLTFKQEEAVNLAMQWDADRTWNALTHTSVYTWYARTSLGVVDRTRPLVTKTTIYDTTNQEIVSQAISVVSANLP